MLCSVVSYDFPKVRNVPKNFRECQPCCSYYDSHIWWHFIHITYSRCLLSIMAVIDSINSCYCLEFLVSCCSVESGLHEGQFRNKNRVDAYRRPGRDRKCMLCYLLIACWLMHMHVLYQTFFANLHCHCVLF